MLIPRLIRLKDAPYYVGMDRHRFNSIVRPTLTVIPVGKHGIAFDRLDLDAWVDHYKDLNGRPARRRSVWDTKKCQDLPCEVGFGTSTKKLTEDEFMKVLEQAASLRRRNT